VIVAACAGKCEAEEGPPNEVDLLGDEAVVGLVFVEGTDHPVAIPRGIQKRCIPHAAHAVGVANDIEPVPRPALTEAFGLEEGVHDLREGGVVG
jgi:hypothetical protein